MPRRNHPRSAPQRPKFPRRSHGTQFEAVSVVRCFTGKAGFTYDVAHRKLDQYAEQANGRHAKPKRIYLCSCGSWHLTSQPLKGA
jgi:hypothetical protein